MFEYFMTLSRVYKVYIFLSFNILFGQFSSNVVHVEIISESEKVEASIIFDEIIDRDDVSGWIDRDNYFTLSLFNVSLVKNNFSGNDYKYPLLSVEAADAGGTVQIIFNTAKKIDSYQLIRYAKDKNLLVVLNNSTTKKLPNDEGELVNSFMSE